jgi:CHAT domain-containing protein/tetratricopeptide (TPR) repeat protein
MSAKVAPLIAALVVVVGASRVPAQSQQAMLAFAQVMQQAADAAGRLDYAAAERFAKQAVEYAEQNLATDAPALVGSAHNRLGEVYYYQSRFAEAEAEARTAIRLSERRKGVPAWAVHLSRTSLAMALAKQGRQAEAEREIERALAAFQAAGLPEVPLQTQAWNALARSYYDLGRYDDAIRYARRGVTAYAKALGPAHPQTLVEMTNLAAALSQAGRKAEAETANRALLEAHARAVPPDPQAYSKALYDFAGFYLLQNRLDDAVPLVEQAAEMRAKAFGEEAPATQEAITLLHEVYRHQGRTADAAAVGKRIRAVAEPKNSVEREQRFAVDSSNAVGAFLDLDLPTFIKHLEQIVADQETLYGVDSPKTAGTLILSAHFKFWFADSKETYALLERIDRILAAHPIEREANQSTIAALRARLAWRDGRRSEAAAGLEESLRMRLQAVLGGSGTAFDRALGLGNLADDSALLAAWRYELGDAAGLYRASEFARSRVMFEQVRSRNVDEYAGLSAEQADDFRTRLGEAYRRLTAAQAAALSAGEGTSVAVKRAREAVEQAQAAYLAVYRELLNSAAAMKLSAHADSPPSAEALVRRCKAEDESVLHYSLFHDASYLLVFMPDREPKAYELSVTPEAAASLGIRSGLVGQGEDGDLLSDAGRRRMTEVINNYNAARGNTPIKPPVPKSPLTSYRLRAALENAAGTGVLQRLRDPRSLAVRGAEVIEPATGGPAVAGLLKQLAALRALLIPEEVLADLTLKPSNTLAIVTDDTLGMLPFEALVAGSGDSPQYLLDVLPPISYASSASLLLKLADRRESPSGTRRSPVLTVADPRYDGPTESSESTPFDSAAASRMLFPGGRPSPIPHSAVESKWVEDVFGEAGVKCGVMRGADAQERWIREFCDNRKIVHLACHAFVDRRYGNLFGALALTPGVDAATDPADDGMLTLAEICRLDLRGCELAILSACETNVGPQQFGEGTSGLSRSFLIAGARRVLAGNWLVDDEAAASLVSYYCGGLAKTMNHPAPTYAAALTEAKRWVKKQPKWSHPYYWAPFVLVGPR